MSKQEKIEKTIVKTLDRYVPDNYTTIGWMKELAEGKMFDELYRNIVAPQTSPEEQRKMFRVIKGGKL